MPRLLDVQRFGAAGRQNLMLGESGAEAEIDASTLHLVPGFVDLCCNPGFPGFPQRESPRSLTAAALAGGFTDLLLSPGVDPVVDTPEQILVHDGIGGPRRWTAAAMTPGLHGKDLAELGLMLRAGAVALSDGSVPIASTVVLRNILEYARGFGATLIFRPADPELDLLGVVNESAVSVRIGLRGNPPATEEIGVARILALLAAMPVAPRVHLSHLGTAAAVALVTQAAKCGLPVSASTPARNLILDEEVLDGFGYESRYRLHPPLRSRRDREVLVEAVMAGQLWLCADHQPRAPEEKEHELERATPGSTGLETAFSAAWTALRSQLPTEQALAVLVQALSLGPRRLLPTASGRPLDAAPVGWTLVDLEAGHTVVPAAHRSMARNDALAGRTLRGQVRGCWPHATLD